jgi:hypothetical protein
MHDEHKRANKTCNLQTPVLAPAPVFILFIRATEKMAACLASVDIPLIFTLVITIEQLFNFVKPAMQMNTSRNNKRKGFCEKSDSR